VRCFLWRQNNPEVKYSPTRIFGDGGSVSRGGITQQEKEKLTLDILKKGIEKND
jgi:hypothetical protein